MKKFLIVSLVLVLVLAGLFFWKGGHHAIAVSEVLEEWLDADNADQSLTLQFQSGGFTVDSATGQLKPEVTHWTMTADTFWTEYGDDQVIGLTAGGVTAYLRRGILYMDTGRSYALPELSELGSTVRRLAAGLLLKGRMTKNENTYTLSMETDELDLSASVTVDRTIQTVTVMAVLPDGESFHATLTPKASQSHPIPQAVKDAMVLARMEQPMSLMEPLDVLLPAMEQLLPLSGQLDLGITSGILELSETVGLTIDGDKASITREGIILDLTLPAELSAGSPAAIAAMLLRDGEMTRDGDSTRFTVTLPGVTTTALLESLVPQATGLGISFAESTMVLTVTSGQLTAASISAEGSVPFLFTTIPVAFSANLTTS